MFLDGTSLSEKILVIIVLCMFIFIYAGTIYLMTNYLIGLFKEKTKRKGKGKEKK